MSLLRRPEENSLEISIFFIPSTSRLVSTAANRVTLQVYVVFPCARSTVPSCLPGTVPLFHMVYLLYLSMNFSTVGH